MKKVTSLTGEAIDFLVSGQRNSRNAVEYHIDESGVIVKDEHAEILKERLGSQISVTAVDIKEAKASVNKEKPKKEETEEGDK